MISLLGYSEGNLSQKSLLNARPMLFSLVVSDTNSNLSGFIITCKATSSLNIVNTIQTQCLMFETIEVL